MAAFVPADIPLSLYIHIPWCVQKCPYCDFNSHQLRGEAPEQDYIDTLLADLDQELQQTDAQHRPLHSIFIGGGTPSLFSPNAIGRLLSGIDQRWGLSANTEITLEANPGTVEQGRFEGFRSAGINRLSIGGQSFNDQALQRLGRIHDGGQLHKAIARALAAGFDNFNVDLMFALPEQTLTGAMDDVQQLCDLGPAHISHYQLTLEPNTRFAHHPPPLPDDDLAWDMQQACQQLLSTHGYQHYEVSAFAQAGHQCQHNLNYWQFGDYLAIGAGAHAKLTGTQAIQRYSKRRQPQDYLQNPTKTAEQRPLTAPELPFEFMLNGLRLTQSIPITLLEQRACAVSSIQAPLKAAQEQGWLIVTDTQLQTTALGQQFLNDLLMLFLPDGDSSHNPNLPK